MNHNSKKNFSIVAESIYFNFVSVCNNIGKDYLPKRHHRTTPTVDCAQSVEDERINNCK